MSELRLPADPEYITAAKLATSAFAAIAELTADQVDEFKIAVAQACENAIASVCDHDPVGRSTGELRLVFRVRQHRLQVSVQSVCGRTGAAAAEERRRRAQLAEQQRTRQQVESRELALQVMGLFVDECRYQRDERTGGLRVHLTKYRVS